MRKDFMMCDIKNKPCNQINTCQYTQNRFGVYDCTPIEEKQKIVNAKHKVEMQERKGKLAKLDKVVSGDNYYKEIDLSYKEAVIDVQAERKKEC